MINNKALGLMGLATRAGKIVAGTDACKEDVQKRKIKLLLIAENASENTKEEFTFLCQKYNIPILVYGDIENISKSIGKVNKAVVGIKDKNFSDEINKIISGGEKNG